MRPVNWETIRRMVYPTVRARNRERITTRSSRGSMMLRR
jgi:hypothetical protein